MKSIEVPGRITDDGEVIAENATVLKDWIGRNAGKSITITIERVSKRRSSPQNRYYWGVCVAMIRKEVNELGNSFSAEEVHDFLKREFNFKEVETEQGYFLKVPESTKRMDTESFMVFIESIRQFASSVLGLYIPDPNEADYSFNQ